MQLSSIVRFNINCDLQLPFTKVINMIHILLKSYSHKSYSR